MTEPELQAILDRITVISDEASNIASELQAPIRDYVPADEKAGFEQYVEDARKKIEAAADTLWVEAREIQAHFERHARSAA